MTNQATDDEELLIFSLVYCSRATQQLDRTAIDQIVAKARINNARHGITGWLVYGSGIFFQWLEGNRDAVKRLMSLISADPRHNTLVVLSESEEVRERLFGEWDMELVSAEDIREVIVDALEESSDRKNVQALRLLLKELDAGRLGAGAHEA